MFENRQRIECYTRFFSHKSKIYYSKADKLMTVIYNL
jgi:hypothetical protein